MAQLVWADLRVAGQVRIRRPLQVARNARRNATHHKRPVLALCPSMREQHSLADLEDIPPR